MAHEELFRKVPHHLTLSPSGGEGRGEGGEAFHHLRMRRRPMNDCLEKLPYIGGTGVSPVLVQAKHRAPPAFHGFTRPPGTGEAG